MHVHLVPVEIRVVGGAHALVEPERSPRHDLAGTGSGQQQQQQQQHVSRTHENSSGGSGGGGPPQQQRVIISSTLRVETGGGAVHSAVAFQGII